MRHTAIMVAAFSLSLSAILLSDTPPTGGAERDIRERLARSGITIGADAESGRYVFIGTCNRILAAPSSDPRFLKTRQECAAVAELTAKRDILCAIRKRINARNEVTLLADGGGAVRMTTSVFEVLSENKLSGASVIASAESWDEETGLYQVAVAVAWTKALLAAAVDATPREVVDEEIDQAEYDRWAGSLDFSVAMGMRQFIDSAGNRRFVGIGCADIEGKSGQQLANAYTVAKTKAMECLAIGLYGDTEMQSFAKTIMAEREGSSEELSVEAWESFVSRVVTRCKKGVRGREVLAKTVVHPITGRRMRVCVFAMPPADQAEMNLFNGKN